MGDPSHRPGSRAATALRRIGLGLVFAAAGAANAREPIIDMHLHARYANYAGANPPPMCTPFLVMPRWDNRKSLGDGLAFGAAPCSNPIAAASTDQQVMRDTLAVMKKRNIIGVISGEPDMMAAWKAAAPDRIIVGLDLKVTTRPGTNHVGVRTPDDVRKLFAAGQFEVLGEVMAQYEGLAPDDPLLEPYWALAERLDMPVGIHMGPGGPGDPYDGNPLYRAANGNPLKLESVLVRHPRLRVYIMHAGYPFEAELRALMFSHPQVYVDVSSIDYTEPRSAFYGFLRNVVEAGYGDRIMFGSDQMVWPGVIERAIEAIEQAPFLSRGQKRDILYNNAARFLRLTPQQIAKHNRM